MDRIIKKILLPFAAVISYILFTCSYSTAQTTLPDSIKQGLLSRDTLTLIGAHMQAYTYYEGKNDSLYEVHLDNAFNLSRRSNDNKNLNSLYNEVFFNLYYRSEFPLALKYIDSCLISAWALNDSDLVARAWMFKGAVYFVTTNYTKSLEYYLKCLRYYEITQSEYLENIYVNIGMLYRELDSDSLAIYYLGKSRDLAVNSKDTVTIVKALNNLAIIKKNSNIHGSAIEIFSKAIKYAEEAGLKEDLSDLYSNIGEVYRNLKQYDTAKDYFDKSLELTIELGKEHGLVSSYYSLAEIAFLSKDYDRCHENLKKAEKYALKYKFYGPLALVYDLWAKVYDAQGHYKKSVSAYRKVLQYNDSAYNYMNTETIKNLQMQYNLEMQARTDSIQKAEQDRMHALQIEKKNQELKMQQLYTYGGVILALLALLTAFVIFKAYSQKKKDNIKITEQKLIIEEKNKNITDSINYARNIQGAILPKEAEISKGLPEYFIYFQPRDIVSGDFYWFAQKNGKIFIAVCDCTGHGVPGAFVSMIGNDQLNHIVIERNITAPDEILTHLNNGIKSAFTGEDKEQQANDGMDMALCVFDSELKTMEFAGAKNPLIIIQDNKLTEIKGDKYAIGGETAINHRFSNNKIELKNGTTLYMFSDGFQDQFGGEQGKKFKIKRFRELLQSLYDKPVEEQKDIIHRSLNQWKGNIAQVDDICVIGIRV